MVEAMTHPLTLVIDEFQEFDRIDAAVFEIDLVCENELTRKLDFYEVKADPARLRTGALEAKAEAFLSKNPQFRDRRMSCRGVSVGFALTEVQRGVMQVCGRR